MVKHCLWSDNWWIEGNYAWAIDGERDLLTLLNLQTGQYELLRELPNESINKFRLNPRCIKCGDVIFCFPDIGQCIWIYHVKLMQFEKIKVENPNRVRLSFSYFWEIANSIFIVSTGLKQIIEIDIGKRIIVDYYDLEKVDDVRIASGIKVGTNIYCVSMSSNHIYEFNILSKKVAKIELPDIKGGLYTICFDGYNFWLSGYCREFYIWNREKNVVIIAGRFPEDFGIYNFDLKSKFLLDCEIKEYPTPTFIASLVVQNFIWFIPFQTNKIIYVDKLTYDIFAFEIETEDEDEVSLINRELNHKYLLEYVREDRYIGLYSFKNKCINEIDTLKKYVKQVEYTFSRECLLDIAHLYENYGRRYDEKNELDREIFVAQLSVCKKNDIAAKRNIGLNIFKQLIGDF